MTKYPPPTPMSSLGRELGIMFAFIGAGLVTMAIYTFAWRGMYSSVQLFYTRHPIPSHPTHTSPQYLHPT